MWWIKSSCNHTSPWSTHIRLHPYQWVDISQPRLKSTYTYTYFWLKFRILSKFRRHTPAGVSAYFQVTPGGPLASWWLVTYWKHHPAARRVSRIRVTVPRCHARPSHPAPPPAAQHYNCARLYRMGTGRLQGNGSVLRHKLDLVLGKILRLFSATMFVGRNWNIPIV